MTSENKSIENKSTKLTNAYSSKEQRIWNTCKFITFFYDHYSTEYIASMGTQARRRMARELKWYLNR